MPLFMMTWKIYADKKDDCFTFFASMTPEADAKDAGNCKLLGRWSDMGSGSGVAIFTAPTGADVQTWAGKWATMGDLNVTPILDDDMAREIILGKKPSWLNAPRYCPAYEAADGETIMVLKFKFAADKKMDGFKAFANMTEAQDKADVGPNKFIGRWHNLALASGVAVAAVKSEFDLYKSAFNWAPMCESIEFIPMITDAVGRAILKAQPGYDQKLAALMKKMGM